MITRRFTIVRFNSQYPERGIVCDCCSHRLAPTYYYNVYEEGQQINDYPFHTRTCSKKYVRQQVLLPNQQAEFEYIPNGTRDFFQEESTED